MIDFIFNACVIFLQALARLLGTTYETVNVWIFCILEPIAFLALAYFAFRLQRKCRQLTKQLHAAQTQNT